MVLYKGLNVCEEYALSHDILFNSLKLKTYFSRYSLKLNSPLIDFRNNRIECVNECFCLEYTYRVIYQTKMCSTLRKNLTESAIN